MAGQRCPVKQLALCAGAGPDAVGFEFESSLAPRGPGVLGPFRKQTSRTGVLITITHQLSWLASTRLTLHVHSHPTVTTVVRGFIIVPISQMRVMRHRDELLVAKAGFEPRQWSQSPKRRREGLEACGSGHWRPSCPQRGLFTAK